MMPTETNPVLTDIQIAQATVPHAIHEVADRLGIPHHAVEPYGRYKAKFGFDFLTHLEDKPRGRVVLVTAISPTPAGEGKTTTTIGLGDAMNALGARTAICLREPSMGPVFGMKGGATGGGHAQAIPMEDINLHFTGDFAAIAQAHNLLAALIDNHIHHGNALDIDVRRIVWRRTLDMNDRALRDVTVSLGGPGNGFPRQDGFDIVAASEVMAILCLARNIKDLKHRLGQIVIAYTRTHEPVRAADLQAHGAMAVLLREAIKPNLAQTLEGNPVLIHGGPFANIAHGCNSLIATTTAAQLAPWVVTEAGFGADLGAEKFIDIKCRKGGIRPAAVVIVATLRALKYHGGVLLSELNKENTDALSAGLANLERHVDNIRQHFGLHCTVAINHFTFDTEAEIELVQSCMARHGVKAIVCRHWAQGSDGARELAEEVLSVAAEPSEPLKTLYPDDMPLTDKIRTIATKLYGAADIRVSGKAKARIAQLEAAGYGHFPVCIAKTQYSFSTDPASKGAPSGHFLDVREVRLAAGAEFVVVICGDIMTMPGLPKNPAATLIDLDAEGRIVGLA
jgi:formate--tetrahydrofolate ligase